MKKKANNVNGALEVFQHMMENKIGDRMALFYVGYAVVLEKTFRNYSDARSIYELGIKK